MKVARQVAALPVRISEDGSLQVLLVTSRETRRWVIPKGWPWPDRAKHLAAAGEAREEAGVRGKARKKKVGTYRYEKRLENGTRPVRVEIFLLLVKRELDKWPERRERSRAWFSPQAAAEAVDEPELRDLLRNLETLLGAKLKRSKVKTAKPASAAKKEVKRDNKGGGILERKAKPLRQRSTAPR